MKRLAETRSMATQQPARPEGPCPGSVLQECRTLARDGELDAAAARLKTLECGSREGEVARLDLLARVEVQRGRLLSGSTAWQQVLALDPENAGAIAGLGALQRGRARGVGIPSAWLVALLLVALVAFQFELDRIETGLRELSAPVESRSPIVGLQPTTPAPTRSAHPIPEDRTAGDVVLAHAATSVTPMDLHPGSQSERPIWASMFRRWSPLSETSERGICWGCGVQHGGGRERRRRPRPNRAELARSELS